MIKLFTVPILDSAEVEEELNHFLAAHRTISIEKQFVQLGENAYWSFVVTYHGKHDGKPSNGKRPPVDYREILDEEDFSRFAKLRELRNRLAKEEGKPAYAIFTNDQLARLVTERVNSRESMTAIEGIGEARIKKYADSFLKLLQEFDTGALS